MAKQLPKVFYGLHFCEGVAEYDQEGQPPMRLYINENVIKKMNPTFAGCPVYVGHQNVNMDKLQQEADGYVVESFWNKADGKCWVKFVVVSDKGHEAIAKGYRLSNSYAVKQSAIGGKWHNVDYSQEVVEGIYNHLAIVEKPRYDESIILTPEQFKDYNLKKEQELTMLQNSLNPKAEKKSMFKFFKKAAIENSDEISKSIIKLSNGEEKSVEELVNMAEEKMKESKNSDDKDADDKKMVKVGNEEVSIEDLKNCYAAMKKNEEDKKAAEAKNAEDEELKKKQNAEEEEKKKKEEEEAKNKKNAEEEDKTKLNAIKNAIENVDNSVTIDTTINKVARGQSLYGSKK